jgi:predicted Zn-dependent protease
MSCLPVDRGSVLRLTRAAAREVERASSEIRIPGHPRPYYLSFLIREEEDWRIQARYGGLFANTYDRKRNGFVDVRVGSYRSDQVRDGGLDDNDKEAESYGYVDLPYGDNLDGVLHGLWRLTDARYREAVEMLLHKRSHELTYRDTHRHLPSFERREPVVDLRWEPLPEVDREAWVGYVERVSRMIKRYPDIKDSHVEFRAEHTCRIFVNTEGSRQIQCSAIWWVECYLWLLGERGDAFPWTLKYTVADPAELPDEKAIRTRIRETVHKLRRLAGATTVRSFCGPALLEPVPSGLLMHEALGHRLEGNRLLASGEGQTFKGSLGQQILPPFLSLRDDPTLKRFRGHSLVGHYRYDDEGVEAQEAPLVSRGKLAGFLTSRTGIARRHRSNGHARSYYHQRPISRMGVLLVETSDGLTDAELKRVFLDEIRRQNAPFGIRIIEASSGETATDAYDFQAFLGEINLASKVYPDGREEPIRGANFVGTPLNAIRGIVAAGNRYEVDNAFCGAESGYVPVTTISPALVISELELQSKPDQPYTEYTLPMPWESPRRGRGRPGKR